jgi:splicing factor U2AF subunit
MNMVDAKELEDEEEWHNIIEDVEEECEKFGKVLKVHVPRPAASSAPAEGVAEEKPVKGVGSIFVQFEEAAQTEKARVGLHGRMFQGKQVIAVFYNEDKFASGELE